MLQASVNALYKHDDFIFNDYAEQLFLPQKYSQLGPFISTGDINGDGDLDLLITYGDVRFSDTSMYYQPRLYLNDGKGNFTLSANAIPSNVTNHCRLRNRCRL